jgi:L-aminopeptidase/D-esterase-like protein
VLGPFRAAVHVAGLATGSRELGALAPEHLVPRADALLLTGGSAFGLAAADGVMAWLAERGRGFATHVAPVPIVPAAVIFDLREGVGRPDAPTGRAACDAAHDGPVEGGRVGAGAGATVGKLAGRAAASPGGVGSVLARVAGVSVGALAVVNALGDVLDAAGAIVAGARGTDGALLDARALIRGSEAGTAPDAPLRGGSSTTLCVVATDLPLGPADLARLARMAATALPRRIRPVHTPFDGDIVFALAPAEPAPEPVDPMTMLVAGEAAREALEESITRAVLVS